MGKNRKNRQPRKSSKLKFIVLGIAAALVISGVSAALVGEGGQGNRLSVDTTRGSPILGSESAPVTIIEFGDYQCPYCQMWNQQTKPAIEANYIESGKANLIFVDFPIIGPDSVKAHASTYCADEQGLYWQYHDFLYANQGHENDGWASANSLKLLATKMPGLDVEAFSGCVDSGMYESRVQTNKGIATQAGARSTPSFIIVGPEGSATQITGAQPYGTFQMAIDEKLGQ